VRVEIDVIGGTKIRARLTRMGSNVINMRPAMSKVADYILMAESRIFDSQGRRGGGSWKRVTVEWARRKREQGLDPRILHARGRLRNSMTKRGDKNQKLILTSSSVTVGSELPYAEAMNRERPFVKLLPGDHAKMREIVRAHIMS